MSLRPKKNTKTTYQQWLDADKATRVAKKLKQTTTIRKRTMAIIKRIKRVDSFAELHNLGSEVDRIRLNKFEAAAIKKATNAQSKKIKTTRARSAKTEDMRRRKKKLRCPVCRERLIHDKLFDMYDCPNRHHGALKHGFAYEETLTDDYKPVY